MKPGYFLLIALVLLAGAAVIVYSRFAPAADAVLVGAGDIADCKTHGAELTAQLISKIDGTVFAVGDEMAWVW